MSFTLTPRAFVESAHAAPQMSGVGHGVEGGLAVVATDIEPGFPPHIDAAIWTGVLDAGGFALA